MGYSHYWERPTELDGAKFDAAVEDCRRVCGAVPIPLGDALGKGEPRFSTDEICFNGHIDSSSFSRDADSTPWPTPNAAGIAKVGGSAEAGHWFGGTLLSSRAVNDDGDGSYEPFVIERVINKLHPSDAEKADGVWFASCTTGFRPYDLCVQFCLIVLKKHFSDVFKVISDGTDNNWKEARDGCQAFLGYGRDFKLD